MGFHKNYFADESNTHFSTSRFEAENAVRNFDLGHSLFILEVYEYVSHAQCIRLRKAEF